MDLKLNHIDFITICGVSNPSDFAWGLRVDKSGIWKIPPDRPEDLTPAEALALRPPGGWDSPLLLFPCSKEEMIRFLEAACMEEFIDDFDTYPVGLGDACPPREESNQNFSNSGDESPDQYVERRRAEGERDEVIAVELTDTSGRFRLRFLDIANLFRLTEGLNDDQHAAKKTRGFRFTKRGRKMIKDRST